MKSHEQDLKHLVDLSGPNSLYVGVVRIRALVLLEKAKDAGKLSGLLDEVLPHWFAALKFSDQERAAFNVSLGKFVGAHDKAVAASQQPATAYTRTEAQVATMEANAIYKDELKSRVESKGSPQSGLKLRGFLTVLNLACLFALWKQSPELKKMALSDFANLAREGHESHVEAGQQRDRRQSARCDRRFCHAGRGDHDRLGRVWGRFVHEQADDCWRGIPGDFGHYSHIGRRACITASSWNSGPPTPSRGAIGQPWTTSGGAGRSSSRQSLDP